MRSTADLTAFMPTPRPESSVTAAAVVKPGAKMSSSASDSSNSAIASAGHPA